jgi:hypothetical protein
MVGERNRSSDAPLTQRRKQAWVCLAGWLGCLVPGCRALGPSRHRSRARARRAAGPGRSAAGQGHQAQRAWALGAGTRGSRRRAPGLGWCAWRCGRSEQGSLVRARWRESMGEKRGGGRERRGREGEMQGGGDGCGWKPAGRVRGRAFRWAPSGPVEIRVFFFFFFYFSEMHF